MPIISKTRTEHEIRIDRFKRASRWCGAAVALAGVVMVALWVLHARLDERIPALWLMKGNTALALAACGAALVLGVGSRDARRLRLSQGLALVAGLLGVLTLVEYTTGTNLGVDAILSIDGTPGLLYPGRMAPQTAIAFTLFAVGVLAAPRREGFRSYVCDASLVMIAMLLHAVMSGYFFHDQSFVGMKGATPMAPQTVAALAVLWIGLVCARADAGLSQILSGEGRGSAAIRYLMPPTILVPVLLSSVRLWGETSGWHDDPFLASSFATFQSLLRIAVILGLGYLLNRSETQRREEQARREKAEQLVAMCAWTRRVRWNDEWMSIDDFLRRRFGLEITHGISDEALADELAALGLAADDLSLLDKAS